MKNNNNEVSILLDTYWSKSDAIIMPLTGLVKNLRYVTKSYLFWEEFSIENYQLIVKFLHKDSTLFDTYSRDYLFPILDKNGYLKEIYECIDGSIFILDLSDWAEDIEIFLKGKYSRLSEGAKNIIKNYHRNRDTTIDSYIYFTLEPNDTRDFLKGLTGLEYVAKKYDFSIDEMRKIGEIGSVYDKKEETLEEKCMQNG